MKCLFAIAISFVILLAPVVEADDGVRWNLLVKSLSGSLYYINKDSLSYTGNSTILAWYKVVPEKKSSFYERLKNLKVFGLKMEDAAYYKVYCEIDCQKKALRMLITAAYTEDHRMLRRDETLDSKWTSIPADSSFDMVRKTICS